MSLSEFRFNKKRKHYAYLFKELGKKRKNILITTKPNILKHKKNNTKVILVNVPLYKHPNPNKDKILDTYYLIPKIYIDELSSFEDKNLKEWSFNINDKRKVKRIKKQKKKSV